MVGFRNERQRVRGNVTGEGHSIFTWHGCICSPVNGQHPVTRGGQDKVRVGQLEIDTEAAQGLKMNIETR